MEGFRPEWRISTIYHVWDTPFWLGTLDIEHVLTLFFFPVACLCGSLYVCVCAVEASLVCAVETFWVWSAPYCVVCVCVCVFRAITCSWLLHCRHTGTLCGWVPSYRSGLTSLTLTSVTWPWPLLPLTLSPHPDPCYIWPHQLTLHPDLCCVTLARLALILTPVASHPNISHPDPCCLWP